MSELIRVFRVVCGVRVLCVLCVLCALGIPVFGSFSAIAGQSAVDDTDTNHADTAATHYVLPDVQAFLDRLKAQPRPKLTREMLAMIRKLPPEKTVGTADLPVGDR